VVSESEIDANDLAVMPDPYEIISIAATQAPDGSSGANWFRYEINQGGNRIVGYRAGAPGAIREDVELIVTRLNLRRQIRRGRVHVVLQSKPAAGAG